MVSVSGAKKIGIVLAMLALAGAGPGCGADDDDDQDQAGMGATGGVGATGATGGTTTTAGTTSTAGSSGAAGSTAGSSGSAGSTAGTSGSAGSTMAGRSGMGGMGGGMMMGGMGGMAGMMMGGSGGTGMMMAGPLKYTGMFTTGMTIPPKNKCLMPVIGGGTGENKSPALSWSGGPADVKSWAVVLYDTEYMMLHWVLWDIPATVKELPEGIPSGYAIAMPMGAHQVSNGPDKKGYYGPCSSGSFAGTYEYRLYALNKEKLELTETSTAAQAQTAVEAAQIEKVVWSGAPM